MTDKELKDLVADNAKSIKELRKSQEKTDEQIQELKESQAKTDEQIQELKESQAKTDEQMKETAEQMKKTAEQFKESDRKWQKISDKIDRLWELYWNSQNNKWAEVEDYFYRYFYNRKRLPWWIKFDKVIRWLIWSADQEHDIVMINWKATALISIKYKLSKEAVDDLIKREITRIKYFLRDVWSDHKLLWWVATFILDDETEEYAKSKWLYVITRRWDDTVILNEEWFVWKEF